MRRPRALLWELPLIALFLACLAFASWRGIRPIQPTDRMRLKFEAIGATAAVTRLPADAAVPTVDLAPAGNPAGGWDIHVVLDHARWPGESSGSGKTLPSARVLLFQGNELLADTDKSTVHVGALPETTVLFSALLIDERRRAYVDADGRVIYRILAGKATPDGFEMTDIR